jgi:hypothetical protein
VGAADDDVEEVSDFEVFAYAVSDETVVPCRMTYHT